MDKNTWPTHMVLTRNPSQNKYLHILKMRVGKNIPSKWTWKKTGVGILMSEKIDFKTKAIKRDKEGHYIILKGTIHQEDMTLVNIHTLNKGWPKYIRKILDDFKKEFDNHTFIVGDFNNPLSTMDGSSKQRINKDIVALNNTLDHMA